MRRVGLFLLPGLLAVAGLAAWFLLRQPRAAEPEIVRMLRAVHAAQLRYRAADRDGDGYLEYAARVEALGEDVPGGGTDYWIRVYPVAGEKYSPDGELLGGFLLAAEPADAAEPAYVMDQEGRLQRLSAGELAGWLEEHAGGGRTGRP